MEAVRLIIEGNGEGIQMMTEQEVKQLLIDTQSYFRRSASLLTSGLHSQCTLKKFPTYCNIQNIQKHFVKELAERFRDRNVELVIGPMTGGILLASRSW